MKPLLRTRRASASVEFALCSLALMLMMLAILYLGDLALVLGAITYGTQVAARAAAVQTGANLSGLGTGAGCLSPNQVTTLFEQALPGIVPPAAPAVQAVWTDNSGGNGTYLRVTATYAWRPPGLSGLLAVTVPLTVTETAMVQGTSGTVVTTCSQGS